MRALVFLGLFVAMGGGSASAGAPPQVDTPTDVIAPYVPPGWKNSTLNGGGGGELAEFTPTGQPTDAFTDLVGYTRRPLRPGATIRPDVDFAAAITAGSAARCSALVIREVKPVGASSQWRFVQQYCVLSTGPSAGRIDVTFDAFALRPTALFSVWRAWRGTPDEFRRFLTDTGKASGEPMATKDGAPAFNEKLLDRATPTILKAWANTFTKVELCDLGAGEICPSFRAPAQALPHNVIASLSLRGSHELTGEQALELEAKVSGPRGAFAQQLLAKVKTGEMPTKSVSFVQSIALADHDWATPGNVMAALLIPVLGARTDGGSLVAIDGTPPADPATRARMQAYLIFASHVLWKLGVSPDRETIVLTPAP